MYLYGFFDGLDFHNYTVLDEYIGSEIGNHLASIPDWYRCFNLRLDAPEFQLTNQRIPVNIFKVSRTESFMDLIRAIDNLSN